MAQANSLTGKIEVGDTVETLNRKIKIVGVVTHISRKKIASVLGSEYDGGPLTHASAHVENLALVTKGRQGGT